MFRRTIEDAFLSWIDHDEILILTGSRQVGKSSFMRYIQSNLGKPNVFYNLEDYELLHLFDESPKNLIKLMKESHPSTEKIYVFIDEIQYLRDPSRFLKYLYDEHKDEIKLIVSGSSAFYLDEKFDDSLAGRKKIFHLSPLSFGEFLIFNQEEGLIKNLKEFSLLTTITQRKIYEYLDLYITYG